MRELPTEGRTGIAQRVRACGLELVSRERLALHDAGGNRRAVVFERSAEGGGGEEVLGRGVEHDL